VQIEKEPLKLYKSLILNLSISDMEAIAQRFAIKIALEAMLRRGLIEDKDLSVIRGFCESTK
jgi:hypothetical protein